MKTPTITYIFRGQVLRKKSWHDGYSETVNGQSQWPPMTQEECRIDAKARESEPLFDLGSGVDFIRKRLSEEDLRKRFQERQRIKACMLTLQGIDDPVAELARLKRCDVALMDVLIWYFLHTTEAMPVELFDQVQAALGRAAVIEASCKAIATK